MSETTDSKIQNLLTQAARQNDLPAPGDSSFASASRICETEAEAEELFERLEAKLFRIEQWDHESEISSFLLFGADGQAQPEKVAAVGDFIRITLPGSGKHDWVKIIKIHKSANETILTIQPSPDPTDKTTDSPNSTSHFFNSDSTNNFCLQRKGEKLNFYVIGLNEKTNTDETSSVIETVRNFATSNVGSYFGIQKTQWETFCRNFLELEKHN